MLCYRTGVNYVCQYMSCVFLAIHYSMSKLSISTVPSLLTQGKGKGTYGSYVHRGYTRLYKFIRTVSWERSWLSNTHFMWPCVPGEIKYGSQNSQEITDIIHRSYRQEFFCFSFSPNASLMWPLRPHFVRSSTGLNHMISSDTEINKSTVNHKAQKVKWNVIFCGHTQKSMTTSSYLC